MSLNVGAYPQLLDAQLRVALLTVADDEKPMLFGKLLQGFPDAGIADVAFIVVHVPVFLIHAPLHQFIPFRGGNGGENHVGNLRHDFAEQRPEQLGVYRQVGKPLLGKLNVVALGYQLPGIPQGAVNVKNQAFVAHEASR